MQINNLWLGVQTNNDFNLVALTAYWKCLSWMPKNAKSFTFRFKHTDYHGNNSNHVTGYASINVTYFSDKENGENPALTEGETKNLHEFINDYSFRLIRVNPYRADEKFTQSPTTENILSAFPFKYDN